MALMQYLLVFHVISYEKNILDEASVTTGEPDIPDSVGTALRSPTTESVCAYRQRPYAHLRLDRGVSGMAEVCGISAAFYPS
jgi:hypothetical protein